jgi:hypothetical protein
MKMRVIKRIINDYEVVVDADNVEDAIMKSIDGDHEPGTLTSEYNDGDTFYPSAWTVISESGEELIPTYEETMRLQELD